MKKIFKVFSLLLFGLVCALVPFGVLFNNSITAKASFDETYTSSMYYYDTSMFLEYADDTLVGVDKEGYIYRSEDGTLANLTNIQVKLPMSLSERAYATNNNAFCYGLNEPLVYGNGKLVYVGSKGAESRVYYSTDKGKNWNYGVVADGSGLLFVDSFINEHPISVVYGN